MKHTNVMFLLLLAAACGTTTTTDGIGSSSDAGTDGGTQTTFTPGTAITAPSQQWTWVPFENSHCGDGSTVGIGVNLNTASSRVLIYFEGGGACWSQLTCEAAQTAVNFTTGYSEAQFASESTNTGFIAEQGGFFDRTTAANPFKDYSYVYVPYCTGDVHAGSNVVQYGSVTAMHVGYDNFTAFLERLVPTFTATDRVVLAGSSGGGYGAIFNWTRTQQVFGSIRVDMIDDSGSVMPPDVAAEGQNGNVEPLWRTQWNLATTLPAGCTACSTNLAALYGFGAQSLPKSRGALISYQQDSVIPAFYGITTAQFEAGLQADVTNQITPNANLKVFESPDSGHVLWFNPTLAQGPVTVQQFITKMVTDDSTWSSVTP
jgi:hypothetical protein